MPDVKTRFQKFVLGLRWLTVLKRLNANGPCDSRAPRLAYCDMKQPIVNLQEKIGKMVGKLPEKGFDYDKLVDAAESFMPRLPFPKGVYKFKSFEEANAWEMEHILKAARQRNQDHQG